MTPATTRAMPDASRGVSFSLRKRAAKAAEKKGLAEATQVAMSTEMNFWL